MAGAYLGDGHDALRPHELAVEGQHVRPDGQRVLGRQHQAVAAQVEFESKT